MIDCERRKCTLRMLSLEDFKGREIKKDWGPFDNLLEVVEVARERLEEEEESLANERELHESGFIKKQISIREGNPQRYATNPPSDALKKINSLFLEENPTGFFRKSMFGPIKINEPGIKGNPIGFSGKKYVTNSAKFCSIVSSVRGKNSSLKEGVSVDKSFRPNFSDEVVKERLMREEFLNRSIAIDERYEAVENEEDDLNMNSQMNISLKYDSAVLDMSMKEWKVGDKFVSKELGYPDCERVKKERPIREKFLERSFVVDSWMDQKQKKYKKRSFEVLIDSGNLARNMKKKVGSKSDPGEPNLPLEFRQRIMELGGTNVVMVFQRELCNTDVSKKHTRFTIPKKQIKEEFLTKDEEVLLNTHDGKKWMAMEVLFIQPDLQECKLSLKRWVWKNSYVLVGGWYSIAERNALKKDDIIQLWTFRRGLQLCFALVIVQRAQGNSLTETI